MSTLALSPWWLAYERGPRVACRWCFFESTAVAVSHADDCPITTPAPVPTRRTP